MGFISHSIVNEGDIGMISYKKNIQITFSLSKYCLILPPTQSAAGKNEILQNKLNEAHKTIQLRRKEAKDHTERSAKAEWAICLCNSRVILIFRSNLETHALFLLLSNTLF